MKSINHFDLILTNKDYARSKPHPDPYLTALSHYELEAQDALVVEDSERDLQTAESGRVGRVPVGTNRSMTALERARPEAKSQSCDTQSTGLRHLRQPKPPRLASNLACQP